MVELLDKLTSYNLLNYLLPGVIFAVLAKDILGVDLVQDDLVVGVFFYYFIGAVVSRLGSIILEPLLKWVRFVRFEKYEDFLVASRKDEKINVLLESSNMFRTLASVFLLLGAFKLALWLETQLGISEDITNIAVLAALFSLFLLSYRKQTEFIVNRIRKQIDGEKL